MLAVFLTMLLAGQQSATATILGNIVPPDKLTISRPARVILLPPAYASLWSSEVQVRLDQYWEQYKPAFAKQKELFYKISSLAQREALEFVLARMQQDGKLNIANVTQSTASGQFEFKNVPVGVYKIVATLTIGQTDYVWSESLQVKDSAPVIVPLKTHTP